ncbi:MAG: helix-turn-helix domain-containing protein [Acidimicrobiales bacterium]
MITAPEAKSAWTPETEVRKGRDITAFSERSHQAVSKSPLPGETPSLQRPRGLAELHGSASEPRNHSKRQHPERFDVAGAAEYLGLSERFMRRLIQERRLAHYKINSRVIFDERDLEAFLTASRREAVRGIRSGTSDRAAALRAKPLTGRLYADDLEWIPDDAPEAAQPLRPDQWGQT